MASKDTKEVVKEATAEEEEEVIEPDSDNESSDNFEDASDSAGGETHDFDRPEEWGECSERVQEGAARVSDTEDVTEEEEKDSCGAVKGSPDYVDEALLEVWEGQLGVEELEQKRLEGVGYKLEGNSLYLEGKTLEACDKYTDGLRCCPLRFTQDRAVLYANR